MSDDDVQASGDSDREAMRHRAAHSGPITDDTLVHRIDFHVVQPRRPGSGGRVPPGRA
ncbi:hypothetical protein [Terrabacter sp. MAHUQ-38]|uniref:hypothetical protein n=1 Tax=unclassified Terrabacter TaxID=2630222 RepID=UPI00165EA9BC|nr:hypothetical protein [Terrabacter sp. MAHUQ-38]MBC9823953.1 hypothetical protein [Terrabacter sp. MAHUQ-38]